MLGNKVLFIFSCFSIGFSNKFLNFNYVTLLSAGAAFCSIAFSLLLHGIELLTSAVGANNSMQLLQGARPK